ncbi:hypothetical protein [Bartonella sp. B17]
MNLDEDVKDFLCKDRIELQDSVLLIIGISPIKRRSRKTESEMYEYTSLGYPIVDGCSLVVIEDLLKWFSSQYEKE